jgi:DNA-binding beta-propeller fold protein YncE
MTLSPYQTAVDLVKVRATLTGPDFGQNEEAIVDLTPDQKTASFKGLGFKTADVRIEGFNEDGRLVAFGRASGVALGTTPSVDVPFRRNLAYVTHKKNDNEPKAQSTVYVFDVATHTYASAVQLPKMGGVGRGVSAKGGDGILVNFDVATTGFLGFLSADDNSWTTVQLASAQDLTLGATGNNIVVSAGGGRVSIVDLSKQMVLKDFPSGGLVLDGAISDDGRRAVFVVDVDPGMFIVDLSDACLSTLDQGRCILNKMAIPQAGGVALAGDGHTVYLTSRGTKNCGLIDLSTLTPTTLNSSAFPTTVGAAAYSDAMSAVWALEVGPNGAPHILGFGTAAPNGPDCTACAGQPLGFDKAINTLYNPTDIAVDPSGARMLVVEAGTSTASSGLTVIETMLGADAVGSTGIYPVDPNDATTQNGLIVNARYQPAHIGILYGR